MGRGLINNRLKWSNGPWFDKQQTKMVRMGRGLINNRLKWSDGPWFDKQQTKIVGWAVV